MDDRRSERAAVKRQKELARQAKEAAKLTEQVRARLAVESYEAQLEVLLSVHKGACPAFDWKAVVTEPPPLLPFCAKSEELRAAWDRSRSGNSHISLETARGADRASYEAAMALHHDKVATWGRMRNLASGVLKGDSKSYIQALLELNPFEEISGLGSSLHFTAHSAAVMEVEIKTNGKQAIPTEVKTLTASGKLSTKPMPRTRFHEIYQDYICGCILRAAREVFALLPVEAVIVTALAELVDSGTGLQAGQPVFSVIVDRASLGGLNFDQLDPSDALERMQHRGDFKASRKQEAFARIKPLSFEDVPRARANIGSLDEAIYAARKFRTEMREKLTSFKLTRLEPGQEEG